MKRLLSAGIAVIAFIVIFVAINWKDIPFSFSMPSLAVEVAAAQQNEKDSVGYAKKRGVGTVMEAAGHCFRYEGDLTSWDGWYFDSIPVGDDIMLCYDSVGPSSLKLSLITHEIVIDMGDPKAPDKIKEFLSPLEGIKRFHQDYEEVLDTVDVFDYPYLCTGYYSFTADYADSCTQHAALINKYVCDLSGITPSDLAKVPRLSAFYAGFKPRSGSRPGYTGNVDDIRALSDFLANSTFEDWKHSGETIESSNGARLEIRLNLLNQKFATFSIYSFDREGCNHGMYTESFATLDLSSGKELYNRDIFTSGSLDKVKKLLFEAMFNHKRYRGWNQCMKSPEDVEARLEGWQSPNPALEGTVWEEPERESTFELPEGALTETGVVFSFQPYSIGCWAEGAYHFVVPYSKLRPYLTSQVKQLIDL